MGATGTTLVMAGAREAHGVVHGLVARGRQVIASLPEPERFFDPLPVPTRVDRFDHPEDLRHWIETQKVRSVLDASHAFDAHISRWAYRAALALDLPYLRILRAPWAATRQDQWMMYPSIKRAAAAVTPGVTVFSNTGWASLPDYAGFRGRKLYFRQAHPVTQEPPYRFLEFVSGTPPFSQSQEEELFQSLGIGRLICRNVGGAASFSKLLAARRLGIRVLMIDRPAAPEGAQLAETVVEALAWEANL